MITATRFYVWKRFSAFEIKWTMLSTLLVLTLTIIAWNEEGTTTPKRRPASSMKTSHNFLFCFIKNSKPFTSILVPVGCLCYRLQYEMVRRRNGCFGNFIEWCYLTLRSIIKYTVLHLWTSTDKYACFSITFSIKWITIFMIFAGKFDHYVCAGMHDLCKR